MGEARAPGARGGAEQTEPEDGAPMGVDAPGGQEHGGLGLEADDAEPAHGGADAARRSQIRQVRGDRGGAALKGGCVHVGMAAGIDEADETRFRPGLEFEFEAPDGQGRDGPGLPGIVAPRRGTASVEADSKDEANRSCSVRPAQEPGPVPQRDPPASS